MAKHDDLLNQGPREAPEAETAEEKSKKLGLKSAGGAVAGGGLSKLFLWLFVWNGISSAARIGGWIGIALVLALVAGFIVWRKTRTV
jgi:hypothetical protein